jgi:hypothetical protein
MMLRPLYMIAWVGRSPFPSLCLLKTPSAVETVAFRTGTGYRPWHVHDRLSSAPFSTPR